MKVSNDSQNILSSDTSLSSYRSLYVIDLVPGIVIDKLLAKLPSSSGSSEIIKIEKLQSYSRLTFTEPSIYWIIMKYLLEHYQIDKTAFNILAMHCEDCSKNFLRENNFHCSRNKQLNTGVCDDYENSNNNNNDYDDNENLLYLSKWSKNINKKLINEFGNWPQVYKFKPIINNRSSVLRHDTV